MSFTPTPRKKIALDNIKLRLTAKSPVNEKSNASMLFGLVSNNPRITVYTGSEDEKDRSIQANLDTPTMFAYLELLELLITAEPNTKYKVENKNFIFPGGKRSEAPVVVSELICGKDGNGVIWTSVVANGKPTIKFVFRPSTFHTLFNGDGSQLAPSKVSELYVRGFVHILRSLYAHLSVTEYVVPEPKGAGGGKSYGGNNGGGYNKSYGNNSGNNGGGRSSDTSMDDDIPF